MSDRKKVFVIDSVHPVLMDRLSAAGYQIVDAVSWDKKLLLEKLQDAFGIIIRSKFTLDASFLENAPNLKFIARSGSGLENIDQHYCFLKNIHLFNSPEGNRNAVAEQALGMLLSLMNNVQKSNQEIKSGLWLREENRGEELDGKTVGIIGYGNNGQAFARKLKGFDVRILVYDKYKSNFGDNQIIESTIEQLMQEVDVLSFHIPLTEETRHWANKAFFDSLQRSIYFLNLSRGEVVEANALISAIKNGKVKGAALDVLEFEPKSFESFFNQKLPQSFYELLNFPNVIMTPHIGGWTKESYYKLSNVLADKILATDF